MTDLSSLKLIDVVPKNIRNSKQIKDMAGALQPQLDSVTNAIPSIEIYKRIDELPEPILRMLAWENRVYQYEWALAETLASKRDLVKDSFELNQRRGTRWSIERVLDLVNVDANLQEWFEYGGLPYRFKINLQSINDQAPTPAQIDLINKLIDKYKPLRSALESIDGTLDAEQVNAYAGVSNTMSGVLDVFAFTVENTFTEIDAYSATAISIGLTVDVFPDNYSETISVTINSFGATGLSMGVTVQVEPYTAP